MARTREDNMGILQMTTLLNAGYPLSDKLQMAITQLVCAAARAARRTREPRPPKKVRAASEPWMDIPSKTPTCDKCGAVLAEMHGRSASGCWLQGTICLRCGMKP